MQMVWSKACEVGCAMVECSGLQEHFDRFYNPHRYNLHNYEAPLYLLVCVYGAGYPEDDEDMFYIHHPYRAGQPCSNCPPQYPLCLPTQSVNPTLNPRLFPGACCMEMFTMLI